MSKDKFGKTTTGLKDKKLFLFDMDGTIYEEDRLFDGTHCLLRHIEESGGKYVFITNNSSKSVKDYIEKINNFGINADINNFFTSTQATILYLKEKYPDKKIYCQGTKSFVEELKNAGINTTEKVCLDVDVVLVGFDTELTSEKIRKTCELLRRDIPYVATNQDLRCPVSFGYIPDCGSICQMIENATMKRPIYIGKPERIMVDTIMKKMNYNKENTIVVGDRLYTDIATGLNAGVETVCVLTGEATIEDIENGAIKPTYTFESVKELDQAIERAKTL